MQDEPTEDFFIRPGYVGGFNLIEFNSQDMFLFRLRLDAVLNEILAEQDEEISFRYTDDETTQYNSGIGNFSISIDFDWLIFMHSGIYGVDNTESDEVIEKLAEVLVRHNFDQKHLTEEELAKYKVKIEPNLEI